MSIQQMLLSSGVVPAYYNDFNTPGTLSDFTAVQDGGTGTVAWAIASGAMSASGGSAVQAHNRCDAGPTFADGSVESVMTGADQAGLHMRIAGATQYYNLSVRDASSSLLANSLNVYYRNAGATTTITSNSFGGTPWVRGTPRTWRLEMIGSTINVYMDGALFISVSDSNYLGSGKAGAYTYGALANGFNDFKIQL